MNRYFIVLILFYCFFNSAYTQSVYGGFDDLNDESDFYHNPIRSIFQDSNGYLWIATSNGVRRFDGIFVDSFKKNIISTNGMGDNLINCIDESVDNKILWVGTSIGGIGRLDIYDYDYQYFYIQPDPNNGSGLVQVDAICCVNKNTILVGTKNQGLYYFDVHKKAFISFASVNKTYLNTPKKILSIKKEKDFVWVLSENGLLQFNYKGDYLQSYYFDGKKLQSATQNESKQINGLLEDVEHNLVFTSENVLYKYVWAEANLVRLYTAPDYYELNCIQIDKEGGYWIGTKNEGLIYISSKAVATYYNADYGDNTIPSNHISSLNMVQDKSVLWIGTRNGLVKYDYHKSKFKQFNINKLSNYRVNSVFTLIKDSKNGYWVRSFDGTYYKRNKDSYFQKVFDKQKYHILKGIELDTTGLWFASSKGLLNYSLETENSKLHTFKCEGVDSSRLNLLTGILPYKDHKLFLLSRSGLILYDIKTQAYNVFNQENKKDLNYYYTSLIFNRDSSCIWIGNRRGELSEFDLKTKKYTSYNIRNKLNEGNKPLVILDMQMDNEGKIWLGTYGCGLQIYNPEDNTISEELAVNLLEGYVYGILPDHNGDFWISTNNGICKVDIATKKVEKYGESDGTFCKEFNSCSFYETKDGTMLFGGQNGFIEFHPDSIYKNEYKSKIDIAAILLGKNSVEFDDAIWEEVSYLNDSVINIDGLHSSIKFYISMAQYSRSKESKVQWKLDGFEDEWNIDNVKEAIKYNNLGEGQYILRVKGINHDGVETKNEAKLIINIKADFIHSFYFKILMVFAISIVLYLLIRWRFNWYDSQEQLLSDKVDEKTKELKDANTELEVIHKVLIKQKEELELHRNYLEDIVKVRTYDLERAKTRAEESDRLKTAFLANLSHEIRTPMNAIIGFSTLLQNDEFDEENKNHFLSVIIQSSETLLALINDIIDISRIETGNIELVNNTIFIPDLIQEVLDELKFEDRSNDVNFTKTFVLEKDDESIVIDRFRLKQIVSNLLRNAFKFTKQGYVKLVIKSGNEETLNQLGFDLSHKGAKEIRPIIFTVEDTGIGIEAQNTTLIFEPFQKIANNSKFFKGMGLGLSIVKSLVDLFGGDIIVNSEMGKGTKFIFYIDNQKVDKLDENKLIG